jgi:Rrf2 family protein
MRLSEGVEWTVHCCVLLALLPGDATLPGARLAEFHGVPGPYLVKHLQALTRAGVLESLPGPRGGYRLGRPARDITLRAVVERSAGAARPAACPPASTRGRAASTC